MYNNNNDNNDDWLIHTTLREKSGVYKVAVWGVKLKTCVVSWPSIHSRD